MLCQRHANAHTPGGDPSPRTLPPGPPLGPPTPPRAWGGHGPKRSKGPMGPKGLWAKGLFGPLGPFGAQGRAPSAPWGPSGPLGPLIRNKNYSEWNRYKGKRFVRIIQQYRSIESKFVIYKLRSKLAIQRAHFLSIMKRASIHVWLTGLFGLGI